MSKEVIVPKEAAIEADTHGAVIYNAVYDGKLRFRRAGGRIYIFRDSFEAWKRRLHERRKIRQEELAATANS